MNYSRYPEEFTDLEIDHIQQVLTGEYPLLEQCANKIILSIQENIHMSDEITCGYIDTSPFTDTLWRLGETVSLLKRQYSEFCKDVQAYTVEDAVEAHRLRNI